MIDQAPSPGTIWRHYSGRLYVVMFMTNESEVENMNQKYPRTVVYMGIANGKLWSGPLYDWHRRMTKIDL